MKIGTVHGYPKHCSCKCTQLDSEVRKKNEETCFKKYGTRLASQSKVVQSKMKATCLEKYGAENIYASESFKKRIKEENLRKYGVENAGQRPDIIQKRKETCIKKYGVTDPRQLGIKNTSKGEFDLVSECKKMYSRNNH